MTEVQHNMKHVNFLEAVALRDVHEVRAKEATYQGSWKRRGGVGAYMMAVRKSDRLEEILKNGYRYNVFAAIERDPSGKDGSALAEVRDLRRYLLLIEAEMMARGTVQAPPPPDRVDKAIDGLLAGVGTSELGTSVPAAPAEDSNKHGLVDVGTNGERAVRRVPTPAMQEAAIHTEDVHYSVARSDTDGVAQPPAGSSAPWRTVVKGDPDEPTSPRWAIVDRVLVDRESEMAHLHQLRRGLNNSEFEETVPPWFKHMYTYDHQNRNEWVLQPRYERWAVTGHR